MPAVIKQPGKGRPDRCPTIVFDADYPVHMQLHVKGCAAAKRLTSQHGAGPTSYYGDYSVTSLNDDSGDLIMVNWRHSAMRNDPVNAGVSVAGDPVQNVGADISPHNLGQFRGDSLRIVIRRFLRRSAGYY